MNNVYCDKPGHGSYPLRAYEKDGKIFVDMDSCTECGPHVGRGNAAVAKPACIGMTSTHTHVICAPEAIMRPTTGSRERRGSE